MADSEMVVVHTESHEATARIVVGFLQSEGIEAVISEDDAGDQLPSMEGTHGVKVLVASENGAAARRLLAERDAADAASKADSAD